MNDLEISFVRAGISARKRTTFGLS